MTNIQVEAANIEVLVRRSTNVARVETANIETLVRRTVNIARVESSYVEVLTPSIPAPVADVFTGWGIPRI